MNIYLSDGLKKGKNNLNIIRFILAILVIYSHAFTLGSAKKTNDILYNISSGQISFGSLAVNIFFLLSGILITASYVHSKDSKEYMIARLLRIYPALIICILITIFIFGPIISTLSFYEYMNTPQTWKYLQNTSILLNESRLPGVFNSNPYPVEVNGSLWTLRYELIFYVLVLMLGKYKMLNKYSAIGIVLVSFILYQVSDNPIPRLLTYFSIGILVYMLKEKIRLTRYLGIISLCIVLISLFIPHSVKFIFPIFGVFFVLILAFRTNSMSWFDKYGDYSYGIYIYAFPIQQAVTYYSGNSISPINNFFVSTFITLIMAFLSWNFIEKKMIGKKKMIYKKGLSRNYLIRSR